MPSIRREQDAHFGIALELARKAQSEVTTADGKASVNYTRDLFEVQRRAGRPLEILSKLPFASGMLLKGVALPGVRGHVASINGDELTLRDEATFENFAIYEPARPVANATVLAAAPGSSSLRGGSPVQVARIRRNVVALGGGLYFHESVLVSGSGDWSTTITGLSVGDCLYGLRDFGKSGAPVRAVDAKGNWSGAFAGGPVAQIPARFPKGVGQASGAFVVSSRIQPAVIWWIPGRDAAVINIGSQYACVADLWVF